MAGTQRIKVEDVLRERRLMERAKLLNQAPLEEVLGKIASGDFEELSAYQWRTFHGERRDSRQTLARAPLPPDFLTKYADVAHLLTHNTAVYDDPTEDIIAGDPIIQGYLPRTRTRNEEASVAATDVLRSRRTTIAALASLGLSYADPATALPPPEIIVPPGQL